MTIAGEFESVGISISRLSKPKAFLSWEMASSQRQLARDISIALKDLSAEINDAKLGKYKSLITAHKGYEKEIRASFSKFNTLINDAFTELFTLREAVMKQHSFVSQLSTKLRPFKTIKLH